MSGQVRTMNTLLRELSGGNLRSDGKANEVAERVMKTPQLLPKLIEGLSDPDEVIRGRTALALEKISQIHPELLEGCIPQFVERALTDDVPTVKWHLAIIFGNVPLERETDAVVSTLFHLLKDESAFVKSWSIVSLTILGREYKRKRKEIRKEITLLKHDGSITVRKEVQKALTVLQNENESIPVGWSKTGREYSKKRKKG